MSSHWAVRSFCLWLPGLGSQTHVSVSSFYWNPGPHTGITDTCFCVTSGAGITSTCFCAQLWPEPGFSHLYNKTFLTAPSLQPLLLSFLKPIWLPTPSTAIYKLLFVLSAFHYDDNWFMSKFNVVLSGILNHSDSSPANRSISAFTVSVPANQRCVKLGRILHVWQTCKKVVVNESPRAWDNIIPTLNRSNQAYCISLKVICLLRESCAP